MAKGHSVRELIIQNAMRQFLAEGYERLSIRELIEPLGISKGGFYHHFSSKEALFEAVVEGVFAEWTHATEAATAQSNRTVESRLRELFLSPLDRSGVYYGLLYEGARMLGTARVRLHAVVDELLDRVERLIGEGQSRGEVRDFLDRKTWAFQIAATVEGGFLLASLGGMTDLESHLLGAFENTWRGIKALSI